MPSLKIKKNAGDTALDITAYIADIKWSDNDLDGPGSGRTLDAVMHRNKVGSKRKAEIKLVPMKSLDVLPIMTILKSQYFICQTDLIPDSAGTQTLYMYNSTRTGNVRITTDGKMIHTDVSFNMIER